MKEFVEQLIAHLKTKKGWCSSRTCESVTNEIRKFAEEYKPRTNADRIRNMTDEEPKKRPWCTRDECAHFEEGGGFCNECFIAWFMSDVKDGD